MPPTPVWRARSTDRPYSYVKDALGHRADARREHFGGSGHDVDHLRSIFCTPICVLLLCAPLGIASPQLGWGDAWTFWLNFAAMIPLAKILGDATEELADCLKSDMLTGLLNATFGNAVEMIMTVMFLRTHEYMVVKYSLLGSVLSNMLLVLGMSALVGGFFMTKGSFKNKMHMFNRVGSLVNTSMLLLSCLVFVLVTVFNSVEGIPDSKAGGAASESAETKKKVQVYMLEISRVCAILVIASYFMYIVFQLFTHSAAIADVEAEEGEDSSTSVQDEVGLSLPLSLALLAGSTVVVAVCSEFLSNALEGALEGSRMNKSFLSIVLIPIVGNACEHAAALRFAMQDKMGLSVGIAVGSSVQIALFVVPFSVLVGWAIGDGKDKQGMNINMDLDFGKLNVAVLVLSVLVVLSVIVDAKTNWLEGYMLMTAYAIIAVLYWFLPEGTHHV